jgi:hypothetical protein
LDIDGSECGFWTLAGGSLMFSIWWMLPSEGQRRMKPTILGKLGVWIGGPVFWRCDGVTSRSLLCGIVWKSRAVLGFRRALRVWEREGRYVGGTWLFKSMFTGSWYAIGLLGVKFSGDVEEC